MGDNCAACDEADVRTFVGAMCTSEYEQLRLLASFIKKKSALWSAVKAKDWQEIAGNYNGSDYKTFSYDKKLQAAYETFTPQKSNA